MSEARMEMNQENPIRIAVVGLGWPGQQHSKVLATLPDVQLAACAELNTELGQEWARQYKGQHYSDWQTLLQNETELDALILATPASVRAEPIAACCQRNIALFCEKPPALSTEDAQPISEIIEQSGILNTVGFQFRWHPLAKRMRDLLGGRKALFARLVIAWPVFDWVASKQAPPGLYFKERCGGPLIEQGIHYQDVLRYITQDEPLEVQAFAEMGSNIPKELNGQTRNCEETTVLIARHQSGMMSTHVHNWSHQGNTQQLHLVGRNFELTFDMVNSRLWGTIDNQDIEETTTDDLYVEEIRGFVEAVKTQNQNLLRSPYGDACRSLAVCEAGARSLISGKAETVKANA